jgi:hypothetical protein
MPKLRHSQFCERPLCARSGRSWKIARDGRGRMTGHASRSWKLPLGASRASAYLSPDTTTFGQYGRKPNETSAAPERTASETERTRSISDENAMTVLCAAAKVRTFFSRKCGHILCRESESRENKSKRNGYPHDDFLLYGSGADTATIARVTAREGPPLVWCWRPCRIRRRAHAFRRA